MESEREGEREGWRERGRGEGGGGERERGGITPKSPIIKLARRLRF